MKKINTFIDAIEGDLAWRKKEVSRLIAVHSEENSDVVIKAAVLLIYAHWEGYVKNISKMYLWHVCQKKESISDLSDNFFAIQMKGLIKQAFESQEALTLQNELKLKKLVTGEENKVFKLKSDFLKSEKEGSIIDTCGNLKYSVLISILDVVGIGDKDCLKSKENYLDNTLLNNRNRIAHGNKVNLDENDVNLDFDGLKKLKNFVFTLMDNISDDLMEFAEKKYYLESEKSNVDAYIQKSNKELESALKSL